MEREERMGNKPELSRVGLNIEAQILLEEKGTPEVFIDAETRKKLQEDLVANGTNLAPFREGVAKHQGQEVNYENADKKGTLKSQFIFLIESLGKDKLVDIIEGTCRYAIEQKGGGVYKPSHKKEGIEKPSTEEVVQFVREYTESQIAREGGPKFVPQSLPGWKEDAAYRIEAVLSATYVLLRTAAYEKEKEAADYQISESPTRFLRERVWRGQRLALPAESEERKLMEELCSKDEKGGLEIIRQLPARTLGVLVENLTK